MNVAVRSSSAASAVRRGLSPSRAARKVAVRKRGRVARVAVRQATVR
jgi:hypothetical protein